MSAIDKPPFPEPGSLIGKRDDFFCLGRLGRGTFCSIHKCIDMSYAHTLQNGGDQSKESNNNKRQRVVAAKVELSDFTNSGVLDGEATVLRHLSSNMEDDMIPTFVDYVKTSTLSSTTKSSYVKQEEAPQEISAIIMEYLPGEDMHKLRDRHCQSFNFNQPYDPSQPAPSSKMRRLSTPDAVYLCADVLLPLLRSMHDCGVIHRDVKPSNCVRIGTSADEKRFKLVDFGLSKSFVVPMDSALADKNYPWRKDWLLPESKVKVEGGEDGNGEASQSSTASTTKLGGCIRKERNTAEFRGTSMYASLRVHQLRDYTRRDDMWGLLYVFCDLVSGGLPWMVPASERNRDLCQKIKEWVHGERHSVDDSEDQKNDATDEKSGSGTKLCEDRVDELLKGADYHNANYKKRSSTPVADASMLPEPLSMYRDGKKVGALRRVFQHLSTLSFFDEPDYDLIKGCLHSFLDDSRSYHRSSTRQEDDLVSDLSWDQPSSEEADKKRWDRKVGKKVKRKTMTTLFRPSLLFQDEEDRDPLELSTLEEAEREVELVAASESGTGENERVKQTADIEDLLRLPLTLQYRLAQVEYNSIHHDTISTHLAFRDWMELATSLVYDYWDSSKYERGNHRRDDDGYRRELYMKLVQKCLDSSKSFRKFLRPQEYFFYPRSGPQPTESQSVRSLKKRKVTVNISGGTTGSLNRATNRSVRLSFSKVLLCLKHSIETEEGKSIAPPPALSFNKRK